MAIATLMASGFAVKAAFAQAPGVQVVESAPKAHARIGRKRSEFFVRFDRPVDHVKSKLVITQDGRVIERLHALLDSAPQVLFAQAPTLPVGDYLLHWSVVTLQGEHVVEGDIPFNVSDEPPK